MGGKRCLKVSLVAILFAYLGMYYYQREGVELFRMSMEEKKHDGDDPLTAVYVAFDHMYFYRKDVVMNVA
jgi:hypothetical protein